jgi:tetratricopeptide (TPR) repeat protein
MKKFCIIVLILIGIVAYGQKREVTNAWSYLKDGFLDDAKTSIDKAEKNPETKDFYKTYWFKGKIYRELSVTTDKKYKALCKDMDCLDVAYEALMKSVKLNFKKEENRNLDLTKQVDLMKFSKIVMDNAYNDKGDFEDIESISEIVGLVLTAIKNDFYNQGIIAMQKQDFERAYLKFEKAVSISFASVDTQLYYLTSLAALETKRYDKVAQISTELIKLNYGANEEEKVRIYLNQAIAYRELNDTVKMLKTIDEGISKYPKSNYPLIIEAFNYYVPREQHEKAIECINMALEKDPNNAQFHAIKGTLLESLKNSAKAKQSYEKALELDANNFDANFQLGVLYYNAAADTIAWAENNIPPKEFAKAAIYDEIALKLIEESIPYFEKAYQLQPKNLDVLQNLRTVYHKTKKREKSEEIGRQIKELTTQKEETKE